MTLQSLHPYYRTLKIIFFGLLIGQLFFMLIMVFLRSSITNNLLGEEIVIFHYLVPLFLVIFSSLSFFLFQSKKNKLSELNSLEEKLVAYRSAILIKYALLETPTFIALIAFYLSGDWNFIAYVIIVLVLFLTAIPRIQKFAEDLQVDEKLFNN